MSSVVDQGVVITGDIFGEDSLTVRGVVKGSIFLQKGDLHIGQSGYVEGELFANNIVVAGEILGNMPHISIFKPSKEDLPFYPQ